MSEFSERIERVQKKLTEWKEKYEIPSHMEFEVITLLKLQDEYDQIEMGSHTTMTRRTLLDMIQRLHRDMRLFPKAIVLKPMYIDCVRTEGDEAIKILIYIENKIITLDSKLYKNPKSMKDYAKMIHDVTIKGYEIYIDIRGFGMGLYDYLVEYTDLKVNELVYSKGL
ncbi:MAG TPA: hypothetical protein DEG71_08395 [Clostridiales bacterium]|nr:hypothetical protein [Clostridiales bacterium]